MLLATLGTASATVVALHAAAWRYASRRRGALEAVCAEHDEPLPFRLHAGAFVSECVLSMILPPLGLLGPPAMLRGTGDRTPVVLLHARGARGIVWPLASHLTRAGWPAVAIASTGGLLATAHAAIADAVARARAATGAERVDLVAFGAAGLPARVFASEPDAGVRRLVTIATPHHGTHAPWPFGARRLRPDGTWVRHADAAGGGRPDVGCVAIYSTDDPALLPATNAYLRGAVAAEVRGLGHLGTFAAPRVLSLVADALTDGSPATLPAAS